MATLVKSEPKENESAISFPVSGMTCAACQARVQRALTSEPGVMDASVNLVTKSAAVRFDPSIVNPERLVAAVRATGYEADLPAAEENVLTESSRGDSEIREARSLAVRAIVSVLAGVVAMAVSMVSIGRPSINYFLLALRARIVS